MNEPGLVLGAIAILLVTVLFYKLLLAPSSESDVVVNEVGLKAKAYTREEVQKHRSADDCWLVIDSKVYNVTPYIEEHPGGNAILKHAGGDASAGFHGPQHPPRVFDLIDDFHIGSLVDHASFSAQ